MKFMRLVFKRRLNALDVLMVIFAGALVVDSWYFSAFFVWVSGTVVSVMAENMAGFKYGDEKQ